MSDVSQGPGWWQASDEKWYPPEQHPDRQEAPAPPPPSPASPAGSAAGPAAGPVGASGAAVSFAFDLKRWSRQDQICGIATLVLFIALFLPWFSYNLVFVTVSVDGLWHGWTYLVLLLSLAILAYIVLRAGLKEMPELPMADAQLLLIATSVNALLVVLAFVFKPSGSGWDYGAVLGLIAAIVAWIPFVLPFAHSRAASPQ